MNKSNHSPDLGHATLEDHGALGDAQVGAVTGGTRAQSVLNTKAVARPEPLYPPIAK